MTGTLILPIHVAAGGLALVLGALALGVRKGGTLHRQSGVLFVGAMLVMGITAALLGNPVGGLMAIYFVVTAHATVRPDSRTNRVVHALAMTFAIAFALVTFPAGVAAFRSPSGARDGVPFAMYFYLATVMLTAAAGDALVLRGGLPRGGRRLARHLWRMCFALFVAAGSFFAVRERVAKILPAPFTTLSMRMLPIALVFVAMFYWLWRVRSRRPLRVITRHDAPAR